MQNVYDAIGGFDGLRRLAHAWHARALADEVVAHAFSHMDTRAIACFDAALGDVGLAPDDPVRQTLRAYWAWAATTSMARYPDSVDDVPDGLALPRWSWDGPQS